MVLRKILDKFRSPRKLQKGSSAETDERNSSWQQQDGGGGDSKKKLKKVRSVRVADLVDGIRKPPKRTGHPQLNEPPAYKAAADIVTPNYMKSTSSYDARKEKHQVNTNSSTSTSRIKSTKKSTTQASFKPLSLVRNSSLRLMRKKMNVSRATCSSTIKVSKAQMPLDLNENDVPPENKVCPYAYCSLHGHKHGTVPSLKRFLSARRQSLKTQKSMKLQGYSSIRRKADKEIELVEDVVTELFIEIQSNLRAHTLLQLGSDQIDIKIMIDKINRMKLEDHHDMNQPHESCSVTSFEDSGDKNSELSMDEIQVINQFIEYIDKGWQEEEEEEGEVNLSSILQYNLSEKESLQSPRGSIKEVWFKQESHCGEQGKDNFKAFGFENHVEDEADTDSFDNGLQSQKVEVKDSASAEYMENTNEFNPRPPRFLPMQDEHEQEQVNLKHQTIKERKAAEEWMIDYALTKALRRLAPAGKRKVELLAAAFEAVMPQMCGTLLHCDASGYIGSNPAVLIRRSQNC